MTSVALQLDPTNAEQLAAWDGEEGAYWTGHADRFDRSVAVHHERFLAAAALRATDRVLDVGCGTGQTTRDAARLASAGHVLGVDLSSAMLEYARRQAEREALRNVTFVQADAQIHPFEPGGADAVISRTGAMFFGDLPAAFSNLRRALRQDGRLVLVTWQPIGENEWLPAFATALAAGRPPLVPPPNAGPFSLSEPDRVRALLGDAGFADVSFDASEGPMWFGADAADAYDFLLGQLAWMLTRLDEAERQRALEALHAATAAHETADGVTFGSAAWIITARAA